MKQSLTMLGLAACLLPVQASAQTAAPLTPSLLQWTWWVTEFPGKHDDSPAPTFFIDAEQQFVTGKTACDTDWSARVAIKFPKISISDVQAPAYECEHAKEVSRFLTIVEEAERFRTSPDGLEILGKDGQRLMLMVSGG